jgi:hypothetical protein
VCLQINLNLILDIYLVHDLFISPSVGGVELVEYVCTHPCLINYFSEEDPDFVLEDVE